MAIMLNGTKLKKLCIGGKTVNKILRNDLVVYQRQTDLNITISFTKWDSAGHFDLVKPVFVLSDGTLFTPTFTPVSYENRSDNTTYDVVKDQDGYEYTMVGCYRGYNFSNFQGFDRTLKTKFGGKYDVDLSCWYTYPPPSEASPNQIIITSKRPDIVGIAFSGYCGNISSWGSSYNLLNASVGDKLIFNYTSSSASGTGETRTINSVVYMKRHYFINDGTGKYEHYVAWAISENASTNKFRTFLINSVTDEVTEFNSIYDMIKTNGYDRDNGTYLPDMTLHISRTISIDSPWASSYRSISDGEIILADGTYVDAISTFATTGVNGTYGARFEFKQDGKALGVCLMTASHSTYSNPSHTAWTTPYRSDGVHSYGRWGHTNSLSANTPQKIKFELYTYPETAAEKAPVAITLSPMNRYSDYSTSTYIVGEMRDVDADTTLFTSTDAKSFLNTCVLNNEYGMTCVVTKTCAKMAYYKLAYIATGTDPQLEQKLYLRSKADPTVVTEKSVQEIIDNDTFDGFINDLDNYPLQAALSLKRTFTTDSNYATLSNAFVIGANGEVANQFEIISDSSNTLVPGTLGYTETIKASYYDEENDTTTELGTIMIRSSAQDAYTTNTSLGAIFGNGNKHYLPVYSMQVSATQDQEYKLEYYATSGIKAIVIGLYANTIAYNGTYDRCWGYVKDTLNNRVILDTKDTATYRSETTRDNNSTTHYRLAVVLTEGKSYNAWVKVTLSSYGTATSNGEAKQYHNLFLNGDIIEDMKLFKVDAFIANGRTNGTYPNDISTLPQVQLSFGNNLDTQTTASLNAGALYSSADAHIGGLSVKADGITSAGNPYSVVTAEHKNAYIENEFASTSPSSLVVSPYQTTAESAGGAAKSIKIASQAARYLAVTPSSPDFVNGSSVSVPLDVSAYESSDYYRFTVSGGGSCNMIERFLFNLKDGTQLHYLGYADEAFNKQYGGETYAYSFTAVFTRDQSVPAITTSPKVVTYDPSNTNLVAIRIISKTYYYSTGYVMRYSFLPVGAFKNFSQYGGMAGGSSDQNFWICFPANGNISIDEIESFTYSNCFEGHSYAYNNYGFTKMSYRRIDIATQTEMGEVTIDCNKYVDNAITPSIPARVIPEDAPSTYFKVGDAEVINATTMDEFNASETKEVNGTKYIARYIIDITTKEYAKTWATKSQTPSSIGKLLIHNTSVDKMIAAKASDVILNKYPNGESDALLPLANKFKLTLNSDRGYSGYSAFAWCIPVIDGIAYEAFEASRYDSITSTNGDANPTYYKLKGLADVSTAENRLAFVNKTANSLTYSSSTIFTVNSSLNGSSACNDNELIMKVTFNNRWGASTEYQAGYLFKAIKDTNQWYVLMSSTTSDSWQECEITTGQTIEGAIIIPYNTGTTHGGRLNYHNIIEFKNNDEILLKVEDEISGTSTSSFVDGRAFYADIISGTVTQIN